MSTLPSPFAAHPAAAAVLSATASLAHARRRRTAALINKLCDLPGRRRAAARTTTAAQQPRPWREPGYGIARALSERDHAAGLERLHAALEHTNQGER